MIMYNYLGSYDTRWMLYIIIYIYIHTERHRRDRETRGDIMVVSIVNDIYTGSWVLLTVEVDLAILPGTNGP